MKRVTALILSVMLIVGVALTLSACGEKNRSYDEEEVISAAVPLIRKAATLNGIFWGEGIAYDEDGAYKNGYYYQADTLCLRELGFDTIEELQKMTRKVFSARYSESIFNSVLNPYGDEDEVFGYTRYYQGIECIMVYSRYVPLLTDSVEYFYDTLSVTGSKGDTVNVKITVKITRGETSQTRDIEIGLVEEESGWRIDTPTYASYRTDFD